MSEDTISRQAAIDEIKEIYEWHDNVTKERIIEHFKQLPSAERLGRWEKIELSAPSGDYVMFLCSECAASLYYEPSSYCPNCGARMEVE